MNNIEFLDAAIKAYGENPKVKLTTTGVEIVIGNAIYEGKTLDECVDLMRKIYSETYIHQIGGAKKSV